MFLTLNPSYQRTLRGNVEILTIYQTHVILKVLILLDNLISDFSPLAGLTSLHTLRIERNWGRDISSLDSLNLTDFRYDQVCELPPVGPPVVSRIEGRNFPSVFQAWDHIKNKINVDEATASHDLYFGASFDLWWVTTSTEPYGLAKTFVGDLKRASEMHQRLIDYNANMLFLVEIRIHNHLWSSAFPPDSNFWLRDNNNQIIHNQNGINLINFLNPDVQDLIVDRIVAIEQCGLFDGIMLDGFAWNAIGFVDYHLHSATDAEIIAATTRIFRETRSRVRDDFLILVNANRTKPTAYAEYVNGSFMETEQDHPNGYTYRGLSDIEDALLWNEENLRSPQINCLEGEGIGTESPDSSNNRRWMRVFTTMGLTL